MQPLWETSACRLRVRANLPGPVVSLRVAGFQPRNCFSNEKLRVSFLGRAIALLIARLFRGFGVRAIDISRPAHGRRGSGRAGSRNAKQPARGSLTSTVGSAGLACSPVYSAVPGGKLTLAR